MAWQKCPVCEGYGVVTFLNSKCHTCNGERIISELTGLPPSKNNEDVDISSDNNFSGTN